MKTAIEIQDKVTAPIKSMYNAMNLLISGFERMQNMPGNLVDTKSIAAARSELTNVKTVLSGAEKIFYSHNSIYSRIKRSCDKPIERKK